MFVLFVAMSITSLNAQVVFSEDFEGTVGMTVTSTGTGTGTWGINTRIPSQGSKSDSSVVEQGTATYLTTTASFSTLGKYAVYLDFDQICKIEFADSAYIEVSDDNGTTWQRVTGGNYLGSAQFGNIGSRFNEASYGTFWDPSGPATPLQSWWKRENFDISSLAANKAAVKIRFVIADGNNTGAVGRNGWFLDSIVVSASISEQIPPTIVLGSPIIQDTVYTSDPVSVMASIYDASGIDTALCIVNIMPDNTLDTIPMVYDANTTDTFNCQIPFYGFGRTTNYYVIAWDSSNGHNVDSTNTYHYIAKNSPGGIAEIGDPNSTLGSSFPFYTLYEDARSQFLYTAAEISAAGANSGAITDIAFFVNTIGSPSMSSFTVKMKNYSGNSLTGFESSGFTTVYTSSSYLPAATGWQNINLSTPFAWNGSSNLLIEVCFDNTAWSANSSVKATAAAGKTWGRNADGMSGCSMTGGASQSNRPNIQITITGSSSLTNDIGVANIINPNSGVLVGNNYDIIVDLKNFGVDTITSAQINWSIDGVVKAPYTFGTPTDSIFPGSIKSPITLGTEAATAGTHHVIAWTTLPNGSFDNDIMNDTAKYSFFGCSSILAGVYTIGGTSPSFATFYDAALALNQCGINAPVTFNVRAGTYNEQIQLNDISGTSSTNTIVFQAENGDSTSVILAYDAMGADDNYVVKLNGTNNIVFKNLTIDAKDTTNARAFVLSSYAHHLSFINNIIKTTEGTIIDDDNMALIISTDTVGNNINISNNILSKSSRSIYLEAGTIDATNWIVNNNIIHGNYARAIELTHAASPMVQYNNIQADTSAFDVTYYGVMLNNSSGTPNITKNIIKTNKTNLCYAISIQNSVFDTTNHLLIANNVLDLHVSSVAATLSAGVLNFASQNVDIYNNSIHFKGIQINSANITLYDAVAGTSFNINIANNNLTNNANGYLYYINNVDTALWTCNNNNAYKFNGTDKFAHIVADVNDFNQWVIKSGATNSVSIDPYYNVATGTQINNNLLNDLGTPLSLITDDINGVSRDAQTPDISAYEFNAQPWDIMTMEVLAPLPGCGLSSTETVIVRFRNIGSSDISGSFNASYQVEGSATSVTEAVTATIISGDTLDYTFSATIDMDIFSNGGDSTFIINAWGTLTGDLVQVNDSVTYSVKSGYVPVAPIVSGDTINYGNIATLYAQGMSPYFWETATSTNHLINDTVYVTPNLYDTTEYWVSDRASTGIDTLTVGTGSLTTAHLPVEAYYGYTYSQTIYPASAFNNTAGMIYGIRYNYVGTAGFGPDAIKVYIANISNNSFASNTSWIPLSNLTEVYDGGFTAPAGGGWVDIVFTQPFYYNGTDNLVVAFDENTPGYHSSSDDFNSTATTNFSSIYYYSDGTNPDPASPPSGNLVKASPNTEFIYNPSGCFGPRVPTTVVVENIPSVDASAAQVVNPNGSVSAGVNHDVDVIIMNYGTSNLTSVDVNYQIDGGAITTYNWSGLLPYQQSDTFTVGTINTMPGVLELKVWTSNPNSVNDTINSNDTTTITFTSCMNGTYTIGDTAAGAADYLNFTDAVQILNTVGVCAPVVFLVDSGTYNEQIIIDEIAGASIINNITFQSVDNDSSYVVLKKTLAYANNYVLKLNGTDYITFKNLTIEANGTYYFRTVFIEGNSNHVSFLNNRFISGATTSEASSCIYSSAGAMNYFTAKNNAFINGYCSIFVGGTSASLSKGAIIENNISEEFSGFAFNLNNQDSLVLLNNNMQSESLGSSSWTYYGGIQIGDSKDDMRIIGNTMNLKSFAKTYGIYFHSSQNSVNNRSLLANNTVRIYNGSDVNYGIYINNSVFNLDIVYNSINMADGDINSSAAKLQSTNSQANIKVINNIFNDSIGNAVDVNGVGISVMDNNAYYTNSAIFAKYNGVDKANIGELQAASGKDLNSVAVAPDFISESDLHLANSLLAGLGAPLAIMTVDIDGDPRGAVLTTIGVDEKTMAQFDVGIKTLFNIADTINEGVLATPKVVVRNYGTDTIYAFDISYSNAGSTAVVYNYTDTLAPTGIDTVVLVDFAAIAGNSQFCVSTILATDTSAYNDTKCHSYYGYPTKDALLIDIVKITEECNMTYDTIKVRLTNIGVDTINGYNQNATTISYQSNSFPVITEPYTPVVAPFDTVWYTFTTPVYVGSNNTMDSIYNIKAWINFDNDSYVDNDTIATLVVSPHTPAVPTFTSPLSVVYATQAIMNATSSSNDTILWYYDDVISSNEAQGTQYTTNWYVIQDTSMWLATQGTAAGFEATFGNGVVTNSPTGYPSPFANYYWGNKEQYLILASELHNMGISAGPISKVAFDVDNLNSCPTLGEFKISIGASTQTAINTWEIGLTPVYNNNAFDAVNGWNEFQFVTPLMWDGISNVVIEVCSNNGSYVNSGNASIKTSNTSFKSTLNRHADQAGVCSQATISAYYNKRPNMKITGFGAGCMSQRVEFDVQPQAQPSCEVSTIKTVNTQSRVYMTANEDITVEFANFGSNNQATIPVSYSINGGAAVSDTVSINANDSLTHTFTTKANLSTIGAYNFKIYTDLACDNNALNDTLTTVIENIDPNYCPSSASGTYSFYIEKVQIDNDSNVSVMPLASAYTDFTSNGSLTTVSPANSYAISIGVGSTSSWAANGYIKVYIDYNRDGSYDPVNELVFGTALSGIASSTSYVTGTINVPTDAIIGTSQMRIVCVNNGSATTVFPCGGYTYGETEDYMINIAPIIPQDAGVEEILSISPLTDQTTLPLDVRVRNYGSADINSVDVVYVVNGVSTTYNYTNTILVGDSADISLGNININPGANIICVHTVLTGDDNFFNDEKCTKTFKQAFVNLAYTDSFEGTDIWMPDVIANQWQRGAPTMTNINTAHSPVNVWGIGLDTNYNNNSMDYLYTPKFNIMGIDSALLSFWHYYETEDATDGGYIQYRKNSSFWVALGYIGDTRATNWNNDATGGINKWVGNSNGWIESTFYFDFTTGEFLSTDTIQFRFVFYSNNSINNFDGWAIDDFKFELPIMPNDVSATAIISPVTTAQIGEPMTVKIDVTNLGSAAQTSFDVWYQVASATAVTETFNPTGGLAPGATASYTFTAPAIAPATDFTVCAGTDLTGDAYPQNDDICGNTIAVTLANIDGGVTAIGKIQPIGGVDTTSILMPVVVKAEIKNFGVSTLTSFDVEYSIDNGANWTTEPWTGSIATNEVDTFQFATTFNSPLGNYSICVRTAVPNDAFSGNDMLCNPYIGSSVNDANGLGFEVSQNEPNPANGNVRINYVVPNNADITFELRNTLGQIVYSVEQASFTGSNTIELDANKLANGVYYYSVTFDGKRITRKMIVNQ